MKASQLRLVINAVGFQIGWLAAVIGGGLIAVAALAVILLMHFGFVARCANHGAQPTRTPPGTTTMWSRELPLIITLTVVGVVIDGVMAASGLITFRSDGWIDVVPAVPLWLVCLWVMFATTIYHCLDWMSGRTWLATALGAVAGPLSYWAGANLGAATLPESVTATLLAYAAIWAVLFPMTMAAAARWRHTVER